MDIKPIDRTVKQLLSTGFYKIPRFQRPYSWDDTNIEDFWNDSIAAEDDDYFIGSFVVYPQGRNSDIYMVVDGQQRLTTITLGFAAIRDAFSELHDCDLAEGTQKYIERADDNNKNHFILRPETSYPYLQDQIQRMGDGELRIGDLRTEEMALKKAYEYFKSKVTESLLAVDIDAAVLKEGKRKAKLDRLLGFRERLLRLQLIVILLPGEDDAYLIFETLNTRGKNLGVSDLLKNHLTRLLKVKNQGMDAATEKWKRIRSSLEDVNPQLDINRFLYHSWISRNAYIGQKKLFRKMKDEIVSRDQAIRFLDELIVDAELYRQLSAPEQHVWSREECWLTESLEALKDFGVIQSSPFTLSLLRAFRDARVSKRQADAALGALERFHAQFTGLASKPTGGGTARMYAAPAVALSASSSSESSGRVLSEFKIKLRNRVPDYEEFEAAISALYFAGDSKKDRKLVRYLLRKIDRYHRRDGYPDYSKMSVEHLLPQGVLNGDGNSTERSAVGRLGNLILVPEEVNQKLRDRPMIEKIKILKEKNVPLDGDLEQAGDWGPAAIQCRTKSLAKILHQDALSF